MTETEEKADLQHYLRRARDAMVWKLAGLGEHDVRRPLVPTGTNLLGLIKHLAGVEAGYFGETFGRPFPEPMAWLDGDAEQEPDMWATAEETRDQLVDLYRRVWAHSDETIRLLDLDATGVVPWWPAERNTVTLHRSLVHVIAETQRHAGHADIVRELIDGAVGLRRETGSMGCGDYVAHYNRLQQLAAGFRGN